MDVCLLSRFVDMTYFELDLNTLVLISQANLLYLHTPYTMGSQKITLVLLNVVAVLYCINTLIYNARHLPLCPLNILHLLLGQGNYQRKFICLVVLHFTALCILHCALLCELNKFSKVQMLTNCTEEKSRDAVSQLNKTFKQLIISSFTSKILTRWCSSCTV